MGVGNPRRLTSDARPFTGDIHVDAKVLFRIYLAWTKKRSKEFGPWGGQLRLLPQNLGPATMDCAEYLGMCAKVTGTGASPFKQAAAIVLAGVTNGVVTIDKAGMEPKDNPERLSEIANTLAAFEVASTSAIWTAMHSDAAWVLQCHPHFPSAHTFAEFARTVCAELRRSRCGDLEHCAISVSNLLTSMALVIEMCFYGSNGGFPQPTAGKKVANAKAGEAPRKKEPPICGAIDHEVIANLGSGELGELVFLDFEKHVPRVREIIHEQAGSAN